MFIFFSSVHKRLSHDSKAKPRAKNTSCESGFVVTVFHERVREKRGCDWSALIEISWKHNHDTETAVALSLLPIDESVRTEFLRYFSEFQWAHVRRKGMADVLCMQM